MSVMIAVKQLSKHYQPPKGPVAVQEVAFEIAEGELFSLLGPNGSGKTTLISMLSCLIAPTGGDAEIAGHSITRAPTKVKAAIGVVPQEIALYNGLSAQENLGFWAKMYGLYGKKGNEAVKRALELAGMADHARERVGTFSGGMKRRLNIAVGLLHTPRVLFMDEPTVGIDPQSRRHILDTIKQLNQQGMTILYTTHYMEEAEELSHRIGVMDQGRLIAVGSQEALSRQAGDFSTIRITTAKAGDGLEGIRQSLAEIPDVNKVLVQEDVLVVQARKAEMVLSYVINCLGQAQMPVKQVEIQEPNLESLFLSLTGRALRE